MVSCRLFVTYRPRPLRQIKFDYMRRRFIGLQTNAVIESIPQQQWRKLVFPILFRSIFIRFIFFKTTTYNATGVIIQGRPSLCFSLSLRFLLRELRVSPTRAVRRAPTFRSQFCSLSQVRSSYCFQHAVSGRVYRRKALYLAQLMTKSSESLYIKSCFPIPKYKKFGPTEHYEKF